MRSVTLAEASGFCFGVDRAVKTVEALLAQGRRVATLGPIIHSPPVVEGFAKRGVRVIERPEDTPAGSVLVIRSHGIPAAEERKIKELQIEYSDATCPFVKKLHELASESGRENRTFILMGDANHPEVIGIIGHAGGESYVVKNCEELENLFKTHKFSSDSPLNFAAQTTFNTEEWEKSLEYLKKVCTNALFFDTICFATAKRQAAAMELAGKSDVMIVVGGKESSNTAKLRDVCARFAETYLIEDKSELPEIAEGLKVGVTAGASTPASIIKEVLNAMSETMNPEQNFEEMLEESLKSFNTDEKVHGVVVSISPTEVYVDVGRKQAGFIPVEELSNDPDAKPEDLVKVGDEFDLLIMKTNDQEGTIMLSKRRVDAMKGWDELAEKQESGEVLTGKVIEVVKGGVIVLYGPMRIFVPASQATVSRSDDINELSGKEVKFRIIEVNRQKRRAVGSIRSVLREERKELEDKFWENIAENQQFTGKVKSFTNFGAFVDLGGVDGLVHISELSWNRIKHPSEVLSVGDTVDVYVKSLDREHKKISLGYKRPEDNPWTKLEAEYPVGTVCEVKVVGLTQFGAFASVLPGIDGLIHISQIADRRIDKPQDVLKVGDVVKAKITDIDFDKHRVSLSIRALIEEEKAKADEAAAEATGDTLVYVAEEGGSVDLTGSADSAPEAAAEEPKQEEAPASKAVAAQEPEKATEEAEPAAAKEPEEAPAEEPMKTSAKAEAAEEKPAEEEPDTAEKAEDKPEAKTEE